MTTIEDSKVNERIELTTDEQQEHQDLIDIERGAEDALRTALEYHADLMKKASRRRREWWLALAKRAGLDLSTQKFVAVPTADGYVIVPDPRPGDVL